MWLLVLVAAFLVFLLVVGLGMALVGIAYLVGMALPWMLIVLGTWLLVRALRGDDGRERGRHWDGWHDGGSRESGRRAGHRRQGGRGSPAQGAAESKGGLRESRSDGRPGQPATAVARRELPIDVQVKADQIRHKAETLLGYADRFPPFSQDLHVVRQTTADYLPRTLDAYLALAGRDDPVAVAGGTTALDELRAQLGLLDAKLDDVAQALQRRDVDRLLANRRFLEERFRAPKSDEQADTVRQATDAA